MFPAQMLSRSYPARLNIVEFSYCSVLITFPKLLSEQVPDNRRTNSPFSFASLRICDKFGFSGSFVKKALFFFNPGSPSCNTSIVFFPIASNVSKPPVITLLPVDSTNFDMTSDSKILLLSTTDSLLFTDIVEVDEDFLDSMGDVVSRFTCITFNFDITIYLIILIMDQGLSTSHNIWRHSESLRSALPVGDIVRRALNIFSIIV
ncbi:hypothetical protein ALC57_00632 [Trachymyrmex cornetzi]|uniref:Uncharacterized protein n=1 Tax=Trachymyrmex cornetzi TaxID=471704 RepID=A0A151JRB1_9HYME|nr:hypothetical protein ALC57_00632 [Trachymyrmex cornetzi]